MRNLSLLALAALLSPAVASAATCPPTPLLTRHAVLPGDGATGVPLNTQVMVEYFGIDPGDTAAFQQLVLRPMGGAAVGAAVTVSATPGAGRILVLLKPTAQLSASTKYEVFDKIPATCATTPCAGAGAVVATFTTGTSADSTAPTFNGIMSSTRIAKTCTTSGGSCCGPWESVEIDFNLTTASAETLPVRYNLYSNNLLVVERVEIPRVVVTCTKPTNGGDPTVGLPGAYSLNEGVLGFGSMFVRAVDVAGNQDTNLNVAMPRIICIEQGEDAGTVGAADAGVDAPGGGGGGGSCAVAVGGAGGPGAALLLAGLALVVRRRRCAR